LGWRQRQPLLVGRVPFLGLQRLALLGLQLVFELFFGLE
jgi:hypothetical protein